LTVFGRTKCRSLAAPGGQTGGALAREAVLALPQAERSRMTLLDPQPRRLEDPSGCTDAELIAAVRAGDRAAYAQLYERHERAARRMARQLSASPHDVDDLVAEAFARVFDMLSSGRGPDSAFRAYLLTAVRNGMYERARRDRRLELSEDMARHDRGVPWVDPAEAELNSALAARAFASLPERWRTVLWYSEVEQESTAEVGSRLGLRPNAVAALAYRAREGLRQAFLQAHASGCADEACRATVARLGGWTRDRLSTGDAAKVDAHLATCRRCRQVAAELEDVNSGLRGLLAPLLLGGVAASGGPPAVTAGAASAGAASAGAASAGSAGVAAAGATSVGAVSGGAAAAAGGSVLGWLAGAHAGPAAAVLTAVVVGGTAVAAGVAAPHVVHRGPATGAAAAGPADRVTSGGLVKIVKNATPPASTAPAKAATKQARAVNEAPDKGRSKPRNPQAETVGKDQSKPRNPHAAAPGKGQTKPQSPQAAAPGKDQTKPQSPQVAGPGKGSTKPQNPQAAAPGKGQVKPQNPQAAALGQGRTTTQAAAVGTGQAEQDNADALGTGKPKSAAAVGKGQAHPAAGAGSS
jgi:RNA polymerase sigma factor (sigma-70 family)